MTPRRPGLLASRVLVGVALAGVALLLAGCLATVRALGLPIARLSEQITRVDG